MKKSNGRKKIGTKNTTKIKIRKINYDPDKKVTYHIEVQPDEWDKLKPNAVCRKDRQTFNLQPGWTNFIVQKLWKLHKVPCPFAFKKHYFPTEESRPYLTFFGMCRECGNPINGSMTHEPHPASQIIFDIQTHDTSDLIHDTNTNLAGDRRKEAEAKLENTKPKKYEDEQAEDDLNDSGTKTPYFVTKAVARTVRQKARDKKIGIDKYSSDAVTAIMEMMDDESGILEFFVDPLKVYYWVDNQNKLWNEAADLNLAVSIDASGSVSTRPTIIDDVQSPPVYIYNVTIRFDDEVYSLCQMLSSKHDTIAIAMWLEAWINRGAQIPRQAYVDCSWALLGAMCIVFNLCGYFEYNDKCHAWLQEYNAKVKMKENPTDVIVMLTGLPPCRVMRDRAHLIKAACKWRCFNTPQNWTKKDFYVRLLAFCLEVQNTEELDKVFVALLVVCESEIVDEGSNCAEQYAYLAEKIKTFTHQSYKDTDKGNEDHACSEEHCSFLKEFDVEEQLAWVPNSAGDIKSHLLKLQEKSQLLLNEDKSKKYSQDNSYWLPGIKNNLLRLFKEYPSWTNVTLPHYPFKADPVASSTGSETYFRILKVDYKLVSLSIQRFLIQHLKLLKGATKNGRRNLLKFKEKEKKKVLAAEEEKKSMKEKEKSSEHQMLDIKNTVIKKSSVDYKVDSIVKNLETDSNQLLTTENLIECKSRTREMLYKGKPASILETDSEIARLFNVNEGKDFEFDLLISFYNYNLPYNVKDDGCSLTLKAFMSLKGERFLHGEVIDSVMSIFKHTSEWQDIFYIPTSQSTFILGDQSHFDHPPDWIMYHLDFEFTGKVFIPFSCGQHWCLVMLDLREETLYYFDPKFDNTKSDAVGAIRRFFARAKRIHQEKYGNLHTKKLCLINWKVTKFNNDRALKNLPRQLDSHNCGPFIIYFMAILSGIIHVTNFDPKLYRFCIAEMLLKNVSTDNICLLCYNNRGDFATKVCIKCNRWAHLDCVERWDSKLDEGICELCQ